LDFISRNLFTIATLNLPASWRTVYGGEQVLLLFGLRGHTTRPDGEVLAKVS
jgi:hypothetical protein